jgi:hypothetical protein
MLKIALIPALLAVPFLAAPAPVAVAPCENLIPHEPLLLYDVTGATFGGPIDIGLTVYGDGTARISSFLAGSNTADARVAYVGTDAARQLVQDLVELGAASLCDVPSFINDLPATTLTIFRGGTDSRAHTFSWYDARAPYSTIQQRVQTFIQETFPGF